MARTRHDPDPDDDGDGDDDYDWKNEDYDPDDEETYPSGVYDDDGPATVGCPHCRAEIIEDSERCPKCGAYISMEDAPGGGLSAGGWVLMVLMLLAVAMWVLGR